MGCYSEIFRVLKPGGVFASYEWCLTDAYDPTNAKHREIRQEILIGNGLPTARTTHEVLAAMKAAGFQVTEEADLVKSADVTWYEPIDPYRFWVPWRDFWSFKTTLWGRAVTHYLVWFLELVGVAPKGSMGVSAFLKAGPTTRHGITAHSVFDMCDLCKSSFRLVCYMSFHGCEPIPV